MTLTSILMFSPEFNLERGSATLLFYLFTLELKRKI